MAAVPQFCAVSTVSAVRYWQYRHPPVCHQELGSSEWLIRSSSGIMCPTLDPLVPRGSPNDRLWICGRVHGQAQGQIWLWGQPKMPCAAVMTRQRMQASLAAAGRSQILGLPCCAVRGSSSATHQAGDVLEGIQADCRGELCHGRGGRPPLACAAVDLLSHLAVPADQIFLHPEWTRAGKGAAG